MAISFTEESTTTFPQPAAGGRMTMIDADGDGDMDILYQTGANGTAFQYARSNGDGTYTIQALGSSPFAGLTIPDHNGANFHVGDIDGDGDMDLWAGQTTGAGTGSYFRNDGGAFSSQSSATFPQPGASSRVVMGDFDNDGDADMLYQTVGNGTAFQYAESNGDGTYTLMTQAASPFSGVGAIPDNVGGTHYAGDFDGDGDIDIWAAAASTTGSYYQNDGGGSFSSQSSATFPAPAAATRVAVGDFDSDGDDDILYQTAGDGSVWQYARSNGDGTFTILSQASSPFAGVTLLNHNGSNSLVGDIDGDGDDDLIITTNGTQGEVYYASGSPPSIASTTPADNGTGVGVGANITLTFDESVSKGSGNIYIYRGDGVLIETISVGSAQVTGSGTTWTIDPSVTLAGVTNYYVMIDGGTWVDADGSIFAGIDDAITLNFTTAASNTAPTFTNLNGDAPSFTEGTAVRLDVGGNATVADSEQSSFNGGTLTVSVTANEVAAQDVLSVANIGAGAGQIGVSGSAISYQGVQIATFTGGTSGADLVITLDPDATPAATQALVRALQYNNTSEAPDTSTRTVTVVLTDGAGGTSTTQTVTVGVSGVNDAPTVINGTTVTLAAENEDVANPAGATVSTLFGSHFSDVDGDSFAGIMIGINNANASQGVWQVFTGGAWSDLPALSPTNTYLVSASDSLRFVPAADYSGTPGSIVVLLVDDSAGAVTTGTRLDSSLTGSGGTTRYTNSTVTLGTSITAVEDAAVAVDDTDTVAEAGTLSGTVFANDSDPDGPALAVEAVNGAPGDVGVQITLASGALLTLNADGTYTYDPNGAFADAPAPGSGGVPVTDSFTYTLVGGGTATVTITIIGEDTDDTVTGDSGANVLDGGDGDDTVSGGAGNDTLGGGAGVDTVDYSGAAAGVIARLNTGLVSNDGDGGSDTLSGFENIEGSAFNDTLVGAAGANTLSGGAGQDYLIGLGGNDVLVGGSGAANQLQGGLGDDDYHVDANDTLVEFAGEGHDRVFTTQARLVLAANLEELTYVGAGAFTGVGNDGDNAITGATGDDTLSGRGGDDTLDGGDGVDTADYSLAAGGVSAFLDGTASDDGDGGTDTLTNIENLRGSGFDDTLYGSAGDNVLDGGDGSDVLVGRGGNDTLRGGGGFDLVDYSDATAGVVVKLNIGRASDGEGGTDTLISIEDVNGSLNNDVLVGSGEDNFLYGLDGADYLVGLEGDDYLEGGAGAPNQLQGGLGDDMYYVEANDTLIEFADEGFDSVATTLNRYTLRANFEELAFDGVGDFVGTGNALDNFIYGGEGDDVLTGGQGDDVLVGSSSCGCGGPGFDTVVLAGVFADYLIEDLGGGAWGVTDTVADRDGADLLLDIAQLRFSDGSVFALVPADGAPAPGATKGTADAQVLPGEVEDDALSGKDADQPHILPGLGEDDFLLGKDAHLPLVLPGDEDALEGLLTVEFDISQGFPTHMLTLRPDGGFSGETDDLGRLHDHDGWLF
jgi:VCBS repeat-containing protein